MNKTKMLSAFAAVLILLGAGCSSAPTPSEAVTEEPVAVETPAHVGTWSRLDTYVDGVAQGSVPATLVFSTDSYVSSTSCTVSGDLMVEDENVTMTLVTNDCPSGSIPDVYHSTFSVSEDGERLTLVNTEFGAEVREEYVRQ